MWIIIIVIVVIVIGKFIYDKNELTSKLAKEGGIRNKYKVLIELLMSGDSRSKVFQETSDSITFGVSNIGGATLFTVVQGFNKVVVRWEVNSPVYGKHKMQWDFPEYDDQEDMVDRIANDTGKYQRNVMGF